MKKKMKIAILQMSGVRGDVSANATFVLQKIGKLKPGAVDVICLPEMWSTDFPPPPADVSACAAATVSSLQALSRQAKRLGCRILGSALEEVRRGRKVGYSNTGFVVTAKGFSWAQGYRKIHLFSPLNEHRNFLPGDTLGLFPSPFGALGLAICYDVRFPEQFRALQKKHAKIIFLPSAWPLSRLQHFRLLLQARAVENQVFMVGINRVGLSARGFPFAGHSMVVNPWGDILFEMGEKKVGWGMVEIDLKDVQNARGRLNVLADARLDLYRKWL